MIKRQGIHIFDSSKLTTRNSPPGTSDFVVFGFNFFKSSKDKIKAVSTQPNKQRIVIIPPKILIFSLFS